tara:strand:- start:909 stop:2258 length:1350 start_codon:yes stop_codon:yes gene_type:complete
LNNQSLEKIIEEEYKKYQLYTINDRAIPYAEDGLKPVQRRILYTLFKNKNKGLIKISSLTGLVLTLSPHGPASVDSASTSMGQSHTFSNNYPFIEGKGNYGNRMNPSPAAPRYIEGKLPKVFENILFDDMNQVEMIPSYDEKTVEPKSLKVKLPLVLLNGVQGIATGFSTNIPSFNHRDIIDSMINYIKTKKTKRINPWVRGYKLKPNYSRAENRIEYPMLIEEVKGKVKITELPGMSAEEVNKYLYQFMDEDYIKDIIDNSKHEVDIELLFKKGRRPRIKEIKEKIEKSKYLTPNFTLVKKSGEDEGIKIYKNPEEIISEFTEERLKVVKKRYELLIKDSEEELNKNNEIVRFIKEKHYAIAEKKKDKSEYTKYLKTKKFKYFDYLSELPVYRMTKEEVNKRQLLVKDLSSKIKEYKKIFKSKKLVEEKLIEELQIVKKDLDDYIKKI